MSLQKSIGYQRSLELWVDTTIIGRFETVADEFARGLTDREEWKLACDSIRTSIRAKMLESYRNGQTQPRSVSPKR